jgi:NADH-quinone oxidoreductase subunit C
MEHKAIYELLAEAVGEDSVTFVEDAVEPYVEIAPAKIAEAARLLRDDERLLFDQLMCLSGIDWDGYDEEGKGKSVAILGYTEDGQPETGDHVATGDLGVAYHLYSHRRRHKFTLRLKVPRDAAEVPSVGEIWATARWHEREAWDLLGIRFTGHPDLRRILLEDHWQGHPLRKDYVMPDRWDSVPLDGKPLAVNPFAPLTPPEPPADAPAGPAPDTTGNAPADGDAPAEG